MKNSYSGVIYLIALIVAIGGLLMGFDASVISGANSGIKDEFDLSKIELGWAVSSLTLASAAAMLGAGPLSDRFGRRFILRWAAVLYAISAISSALAPSFGWLVAARMLGGLGVGASLNLAPLYIAEISPKELRGRLVSFNQLNIVIGISLAFFTNYWIEQLGKSSADWVVSLGIGEHSWRYMLGLETIPAVLYFIGLFLVPRSPRWLLMHNQQQEAVDVMAKVVGDDRAKSEVERILGIIEEDKRKDKASFREIFMPALKLVLTIGIVISILQQITGINSVFFYAPMIFEQSGLGKDAALMGAIYLGLTNLVFTVLAILFIDRFGRRPLLIYGVIGIIISMSVLTVGFHKATYTLNADDVEEFSKLNTPEQEDVYVDVDLSSLEGKTYTKSSVLVADLETLVPEEELDVHLQPILNSAISLNTNLILIAILGFVASFAVSLGPVMWVLFSELFPNRVRGVAISFVGLINAGVSFLVQLVFPWELEVLGSSTTFLIYGIFALAGLIFIIRVVPETKGRSLEELEKLLVKKD